MLTLRLLSEALNVTSGGSEELEGVTLNVYSFVVKEGKPVGPRDVMRGAGLSSPSVAYRHLQKLETLGLLMKNEHGEYIVRQKAPVRGYIWVGKNLLPRTLIYAFIFLGVLILEIVILAIHYSVESTSFKIFFLLLSLITATAMILFVVEAMLLRRRIRLRSRQETD